MRSITVIKGANLSCYNTSIIAVEVYVKNRPPNLQAGILPRSVVNEWVWPQ